MAPSDSSPVTWRRPNVDEAVAILRQSLSERYRVACLQYWREKYGEAFAVKVEIIFGSKTRR